MESIEIITKMHKIMLQMRVTDIYLPNGLKIYMDLKKEYEELEKELENGEK